MIVKATCKVRERAERKVNANHKSKSKQSVKSEPEKAKMQICGGGGMRINLFVQFWFCHWHLSTTIWQKNMYIYKLWSNLGENSLLADKSRYTDTARMFLQISFLGAVKV